ncbi:hypothetical protein ARALYDRAFT_494170 [Arabidopsis lyrata subsp. lyrata]|uniref:Uncharacterized protein n=1 Tax=Arabidopsis lyrata subsp. lyrata TaxID=81972 RepID=D7MK54_ARALL|nr:hypothetical protein ARALYDRAFT_494170 [Arabidopsis lyrata subsp. lyrata]
MTNTNVAANKPTSTIEDESSSLLRAWCMNKNLQYNFAMNIFMIIINIEAILYMRNHEIHAIENVLASKAYFVGRIFPVKDQGQKLLTEFGKGPRSGKMTRSGVDQGREIIDRIRCGPRSGKVTESGVDQGREIIDRVQCGPRSRIVTVSAKDQGWEILAKSGLDQGQKFVLVGIRLGRVTFDRVREMDQDRKNGSNVRDGVSHICHTFGFCNFFNLLYSVSPHLALYFGLPCLLGFVAVMIAPGCPYLWEGLCNKVQELRDKWKYVKRPQSSVVIV